MPRDKRPPPSTKILSAEEREINDGRVTDSRTRKELMSVIKSQMQVSSDPNVLAGPRQQLTNKVLACSMRMISMNDDVHKLGNEIKNRNDVVNALLAEIKVNEGMIYKESVEKLENQNTKAGLEEQLKAAKELGRLKDLQKAEANHELGIQEGKNSKLIAVVQASEQGNQVLRDVLENCKSTLNSALG